MAVARADVHAERQRGAAEAARRSKVQRPEDRDPSADVGAPQQST